MSAKPSGEQYPGIWNELPGRAGPGHCAADNLLNCRYRCCEASSISMPMMRAT
jgi:hypothetical protein